MISAGRRISDLAEQHPDQAAMVFVFADASERTVTWRELDSTSNQVARLLEKQGVKEKSMVVVSLPNSPEHYVVSIACWKLGACVLPLRWDLPEAEQQRVFDVAKPAYVVASKDIVEDAAGLSDEQLPDKIAQPGKAVASSGSTGRPKIILLKPPMVYVPELKGGPIAQLMGMEPGWKVLVMGPLYHNNPFGLGHATMLEDSPMVALEKFDPGLVLDIIEKHRISFTTLIPTIAMRLLRHPGALDRDWSSIKAVLIGGSVCPDWVHRQLIELIGAERVWEAYGATEGNGFTIVRGDEWLAHPGTAGKPYGTNLRILDDEGNDVPAGQVGEIYMQAETVKEPIFEYLGAAPPKLSEESLVSLGDLGWMDEEGFVYIADRRVDMVVTGGANVYPAEVEAALTEHPSVADVAVVGVPDPDWVRRVHAIVQPADPSAPPTVEDLDKHCRDRVASYKLPKSYEFVDVLPRTELGKVQKYLLTSERESGDIPGLLWAPSSRVPT